MYRLTISKQNYAQVSVSRLRYTPPQSYAAVCLNVFSFRILYNALNPGMLYLRTVNAGR